MVDRAPPDPAPRPGPVWLLSALHQLGPLRGRPILTSHTFLAAAGSPAEREAAAALHRLQADQLGDDELMGALARTITRSGRSSSAAERSWWPTCSTLHRPSWPRRSGPTWPPPASTPTPEAGRRGRLGRPDRARRCGPRVDDERTCATRRSGGR
jgi:hypothetical protein